MTAHRIGDQGCKPHKNYNGSSPHAAIEASSAIARKLHEWLATTE
jgi:hypothetical protein